MPYETKTFLQMYKTDIIGPHHKYDNNFINELKNLI